MKARRWLPKLSAGAASMSDGVDDDAEGWSINFEWFGLCFELWLTIRGRA